MARSRSRDWLLAGEAAWCLRANTWCERETTRALFGALNRLGDGAFWYPPMLVLVPIDGLEGLQPSPHLAATGPAPQRASRTPPRLPRRPRQLARHPPARPRLAPRPPRPSP